MDSGQEVKVLQVLKSYKCFYSGNTKPEVGITCRAHKRPPSSLRQGQEVGGSQPCWEAPESDGETVLLPVPIPFYILIGLLSRITVVRLKENMLSGATSVFSPF